ncbi:MAG TPA: ABC transporter ATP-binding protein [Planctomycetota bacterium]|nr:ABC transporter ATP-binding protein [Planctomycetota bacterium]
MALLDVDDLHVSFSTDDGIVQAVRGVSFQVHRGKTLGIVGESGSGKSVATQTVTGLTRGASVSGSAIFDGLDLLTATEPELRRIRGARIGMIFQDPLTSLHPLYRVGWQITELIRAHQAGTSRRTARARAAELLDLVGIPTAADRIDDYPYQFSGGMRQRVMIAMALICKPALLIADEPTTALDVTIQAQILDLMQELQKKRSGASILLITHDLAVIAETCNRVIVMYGGKIQEVATVIDLFDNPKHPYTLGLLGSIPHLQDKGSPLDAIPGIVPSIFEYPPGCRFQSRCVHAMDRCRTEEPALHTIAPGHQVRCHLMEDEAKEAR